MKRTLIALLALAGVAAADTVLFDFKGSDLGGVTNPTSVDLTVSDITATIKVTSGDGTLVGGSWANAPTGGNNNISVPAYGSPEYDFIKGSAVGVPLTLTFSGLAAGKTYDISIATGVPFENSGNWNTLKPADDFTYTSASLTTVNANGVATTQSLEEGLDKKVPVKQVGTFTFAGVKANTAGEIAFNITHATSADKYNHSASFNSASVTLVPEPTTATLSLLALAGLAARRRRR